MLFFYQKCFTHVLFLLGHIWSGSKTKTGRNVKGVSLKHDKIPVLCDAVTKGTIIQHVIAVNTFTH